MAIETTDILATLRELFLSDPDDQMDQIELLALGLAENPSGALKDIMRVAHNLKGSAQLCGLSEFAHLVHQSETVFQSMSLHVYSDDDLANAAALIRRLGTLLRKKFEAIRDNTEVNSRELVAWDVTIKGLNLIADSSPLAGQNTNQPTAVVAPTPSSGGDWGFGSTATEPSSASSVAIESDSAKNRQTPMESTAIESTAIEYTAPYAKSPDTKASAAPANQGWGVFGDTPTIETAEPTPEPQGWGIFEDTAVLPATQSAPAAIHGAPATPPTDGKALGSPRPSAPAPIVKSSPMASTSYLLCHHHETTYAVPVDQVQEILPDKKLKALPISRKNVAGVISFRGQIMPVIDMFAGSLLSAFSNVGAPPTTTKKTSSGASSELPTTTKVAGCIVVCQIDRQLFGVRVGRVSTVIDIRDNLLQPVQMKAASEKKNLISHLAIVDNETISFINLLGVLPA